MTCIFRKQNNYLLYNMINGETSTTSALAKRRTAVFMIFLLRRNFSQFNT